MTATLPRLGPPTPVGGPNLLRLGTVYGVLIRDHHDDSERIDYVGETGRALAAREAEHRGLGRNPADEQPWSDRVVRFIALEQGYWTDADRKARELVWIRNTEGRLPHRPRYNWRGNEDCPGQIPKWVAAEQRARRDRAAGVVSRWTNPKLFQTAPSAVGLTRVAVPLQRRRSDPSLWARAWATGPGLALSAWLRRAALVVAVWAAGTLALSVAAAVWAGSFGLPPYELAGAAGLATGGALVRWWPRRRVRGWQRRRRRRW